MARKRIEGTALKSWDEVDATLRRIGQLTRELELIEAAAEEAIEMARTAAKEQADPLGKEKSNCERLLKEFCTAHKADFERQRTRELTFGAVGWRRSSRLVIASVGDTLQALKSLNLLQYVRVKEEIDKEALREAPSETLANVGAYLKPEDTFGYEIKREAIPDGIVTA